jgi:hypothetical protein
MAKQNGSLVKGRFSDLVLATIFTRPSNATQYAQYDVVAPTGGAALLEFELGPLATRKIDGSGLIVGAQVFDSANQATLANFLLYLFDSAPTPIADNSPIALSDADAQKCIGVIQLDKQWRMNASAGDSGSTLHEAKAEALSFDMDPDTTTKLYGILVVDNAYTPVSAEQLAVGIRVLHD